MEREWQKELTQARRQARRDIKRLAQQVVLARSQLAEALAWEEKFHEAQLLQSHLYLVKPGVEKVTVQDWKKDQLSRDIHLEPRVRVEDQLKKRYKLAKKLQKSIPHVEQRLQQFLGYADAAEQRSAALESIEDEEAWNTIKATLPKLQASPKKKSEPPPRQPYRIFHSESGIEIWVGRTAHDNEVLSLKLARGNDWWLHASDVPGSHVVVRHSEPDEATVKDAMQLALFYSRLSKAGEGEVVLTQAKYVGKGPGGHRPGTVSVSKHKSYRVRMDKERLVRLKAH